MIDHTWKEKSRYDYQENITIILLLIITQNDYTTW